VQAVRSDHIRIDFVRHDLFEIDQAAGLLPLLLVVLLIALFEQVEVFVGVTDYYVVAVEGDRCGQVDHTIW